MRQSDPEPDAHRACPLHLPHKAALLRGGLQPHSRGEHQLAAVEEALRVLLLGDGNPLDVLVPRGLRQAGFGELERLYAQQGGEGDCHEFRITARWSTALKGSGDGVQVAIPCVPALA